MIYIYKKEKPLNNSAASLFYNQIFSAFTRRFNQKSKRFF